MPGFEEVDADIDSFFKTGELPASLQAEVTPPTPPADGGESTPPVTAPEGENTPPSGESTPPVSQPATQTPPVEAPKTAVDDATQQLIRLQQQKLDDLQRTLGNLQKAEQDRIAEANKPVAPDPEKDPLGYLTYQIKQVGDQVQAMQQAQTQTQTETAQQTQMRQFVDAVNGQVNSFKGTVTDYDDAYKHLVDLRTRDYQMQGYSADEARGLVGQEELRIAASAMQQGKNPAQVAYELAKSHGYVPKAVKPAQTDTPASKLDSIKKGLETTGAERGAPPPTYSTEAVKNMSNTQLTDAVENHWEEMFGKSKSKGIFD